jgi:hypothetical protein
MFWILEKERSCVHETFLEPLEVRIVDEMDRDREAVSEK